MFTHDALRALLNALPFAPFRLFLSDGGHVDVPSRELVLPGRQFAVIGLLDPATTDMLIDRWTTVWYMHVTRHEMMRPGVPPFTASPPPESPSRAPA